MIKALIVDDEKNTRDSLREFVSWRAMGVGSVETAKNGLAALEMALREMPDLLLTDIRMPKMNGIELAAKIRELSPDCQIIFLSGYADKEYLKEAIHLKAVSYIEKPLDVKEIEAVIMKAITESRSRQASRLAASKRFYLGFEKQVDKALLVDASVGVRLRQYLHADDRDKAIALVRETAQAAGYSQDPDTNRVKSLFYQMLQIVGDTARDLGTSPGPDHDSRSHLAWQRVEAACTLLELADSVIEDIERHFSAIAEKDSTGRKLYLITNYIREHYADPALSTQSIANHVHFSHTYLCAFFKKHAGTTVNAYITEVRMEKAKQLLREGRLKQYEIAQALGYTDANYFTTLFKKHTGVTPARYMEKYYL
ncbi:two-component system, response regulator YesN [Cohnella sp. OV330]|uniref:response regulator transcription factor n=1 Tax=Cohnella sp. OV330 TaxID=1855288 RepID=UPI0008E50FA4|nr:response regulator [Cohnella sp. OV330]SFB56396.1 two-component system, response regulator YesN [Cohnella sp. OV330]